MAQLDKAKESNPYYYTKPAVKLGDCKVGDWVYNQEADLCYVNESEITEGEFQLHSMGIVTHCGNDTIVYPVTLITEYIMRRMKALRDKMHEKGLMNPARNHELCDRLNEIMELSIYDPEYNTKYYEFWENLEARYRELLGYARALGIEKAL
jgi:hypothetical protein